MAEFMNVSDGFSLKSSRYYFYVIIIIIIIIFISYYNGTRFTKEIQLYIYLQKIFIIA